MDHTAHRTSIESTASLELTRFRCFVALSAVVLAILVLAPPSVADPVSLLYAVIALSLGLTRSWRLKGPVRLPALLVALAGVSSLVAGVVRGVEASGTSSSYPYPSLADVLVLLATVLLIFGIATIVRRRNPHLGLDPVLDAVVGGTAAALLNWSLILPDLLNDSLSASGRWVTVGFSLLSALTFMAAILALVAGSLPSTSNRLLAAALMITFAADVFANQVTAGRLNSGVLVLLTTGILAFGGAGLLHPSVRSLLDRPAGVNMIRKLSNRRIAVLTFALITPPLLLLWQVAIGGEGPELLLPAVGAVTLAPLVLVRFGRLVRQNESLASQEATLRSVGERLVEADTEQHVTMAVQTGLHRLLGEDLVDAGFVLAPFTPGAVGWTPELSPALRALSAEMESHPQPVTGEVHPLESVGVPGFWQGGIVVVQRELRGVVLAATTAEMSDGQHNALAALCRQGAIAVRAVERTEVQVRERSEKRFAALIENSSDVVAILDEAGQIAYASPVAERLLGRRPDVGSILDFEKLVHPDDLAGALKLLEDVRFHSRAGGQFRLCHSDGRYRWFEVIASDLMSDPAVGGILFNARAIDDRKRAEEQLQLSEARFKSLVQHSSDLLVVADARERVTYASPSAEMVVGEEPGALIGRHLASVFNGSDVDWHGALRSNSDVESPALIELGFSDINGDWLTLEALVTDLRADPAVGGFVLNARDITERKTMMRHLRHQATHDSLTGLANRVLVVEELDHMLSHNSGSSSVAAICIDLDDFREINDSLGQSTGDEVLMAVSERLRSTLEFGDQAARIGADEFAVIVERAHGEEIVFEIARSLVEQIALPFHIDGREMKLSASAGIAVDHDRGLVGEGLLRNSITAMHQAKRAGRGRVVPFERSMRAASSDRLELRADLARAIGTEQMVVCYQPIVSLDGGTIIGAEALVRWDHPERGRLSPALFVPLAEDSDLIGRLDQQVRATACTDLARWRAEIPTAKDLSVSVNLAVSELHSEDFLSSVLRDLRLSGLPPDRLVLEVTESNLLDDTDLVRERMTALRANGIRMGIDDFGTGYSSLGYINKFEFDLLKIDRSFVAGLGNPTNQRIVTAVLDLAAELGASVVAEGIETPTQEQLLLDLGCTIGQGYLYARPISAAQFRRMLTSSGRVGHDQVR